MEFGSNGQFILKLGSLLLNASLWLLGFRECSLINICGYSQIACINFISCLKATAIDSE
jgi:hypothetical protein